MIGLLAGAVMALEASGPPALPREFRGVWVATVDNIDWPSKPGLPIETQKAELATLLQRVAHLRFNAVLFQVRTSCDALYPSKLEPASWFVTGQQGKALGWDPLAYCVSEGHKLGLEVHAWINPFRAGHPAQKGPYSSSHVSKLHPDWVREYGKYLWLDPGVPAAREHSLAVVRDIVRRYDIDGVHIDDYFYPYPVKGVAFPDDRSYRAYRTNSGNLDKSSWRRQNVDTFVQALGSMIRAEKPSVKFGVSPFGIYRPGVPAGIKADLDQYESLGADVLKWLRQGWCDYFSPQLYWKRDSVGQPYAKLLAWWLRQNQAERHLWPGLYATKWESDEILAQRKLAQASGGCVLFSFKALKRGDALGYAGPALVPESPWLGDRPPDTPKVRLGDQLQWSAVPAARFYVVWTETHGNWSVLAVTDATSVARPTAERVAVVAVSLSGIEGIPATVDLR